MVLTNYILKIVTFNCQGFKSSANDVRLLCENHDVLFLQELSLHNDEMVLLKQIHKDFTGVGISPMKEDQSLLSGRPFGGVGIVWRKSIDTFCKVKKYNDNRLI